MIVFLDPNILGLLANPNKLPKAIKCRAWFERLSARGVYFVSSELCYYELKRSLVLAVKKGRNPQGLNKLIFLRNLIDFLSVTESVADMAAEIWAEARIKGTPTAEEENIDVDMIVAAHWHLLTDEFPGRYIVIATTNVRHLSLFAEAEEWQNLSY